MGVLKRLNINKFTSEADNDAFIEELKQMWLAWENLYLGFPPAKRADPIRLVMNLGGPSSLTESLVQAR